MYCIVRLKNLSPNTEAQPVGWVIEETLSDLRGRLYNRNEIELYEKLREYRGYGGGCYEVGHQTYLLID